jgi:hypothetical protein
MALFFFFLNYVDDMLYYGNSDDLLLTFETQLSEQFNLETKGQAHWYLATRITQLASYDIILDQTRYCSSIIKKYLDSVGCKNVSRKHTIPLPCDFVPTSEDCSETEEKAAILMDEYKLDYASCIGSLIYLSQTRPDIIFAVNKLARYMRKPGKCISRLWYIFFVTSEIIIILELDSSPIIPLRHYIII